MGTMKHIETLGLWRISRTSQWAEFKPTVTTLMPIHGGTINRHVMAKGLSSAS